MAKLPNNGGEQAQHLGEGWPTKLNKWLRFSSFAPNTAAPALTSSNTADAVSITDARFALPEEDESSADELVFRNNATSLEAAYAELSQFYSETNSSLEKFAQNPELTKHISFAFKPEALNQVISQINDFIVGASSKRRGILSFHVSTLADQNRRTGANHAFYTSFKNATYEAQAHLYAARSKRNDLLDKIRGYARMSEGWDGRAAKPLSQNAVDGARGFIEVFNNILDEQGQPSNDFMPKADPSPDGSLTLYWEMGEIYASIDFGEDESAEWYITGGLSGDREGTDGISKDAAYQPGDFPRILMSRLSR